MPVVDALRGPRNYAFVFGLTLMSTAFAGACSGLPPCSRPLHGMTLVIHVDPALADGTVTTEGACTPASCADPRDAQSSQCSTWHAEMTGGFQSECNVTLALPNGERRQQQERSRYIANFCS